MSIYACSRCGSYGPNPDCYVCSDGQSGDEPDAMDASKEWQEQQLLEDQEHE